MFLGDEELSENEQLLEDLIEKFEEKERRTKADTQKRQFYIKNERKKANEMSKKAMEKIWRDNKMEGARWKWHWG